MRHNLLVYLDSFRFQLLGLSYFRLDFWLGMGASVLHQGATLAVLGLIFRQVESLGGWDMYQSMLLYAFFAISVGMANVLGSGLRDVPEMVLQGQLDSILVLPVNPYLRLLPDINLSAMIDVLVALIILIISSFGAGVVWSAATVAYALIAVACGTGVILGFMTVLYGLSFWIPYRGLMQGAEGLTQLSRYPLGIYPAWLKAVITWVVPISFASYYPAAALAGMEQQPFTTLLFSLAAAVGMLAVGAIIWRRGLCRYEGTGG